MSNLAVRVENLSKTYRIGSKQPIYRTLRETINDVFMAPFRFLKQNRNSAMRNPKSNLFWALKDVSFEIHSGEVLGIIGRNGAGKSTLLKILSRITEPTKGRAEIYGRVGSLLEVGTGFHSELTGRENIYLNGAILGMKKAEIYRKFDEIVAFAEVEKFLDTPVKYYSSGMYLRLAFAVAAHLDPEILLVDEVLAVGDAFFQKKCLGKMRDVAHEGRTVLFVSHQMNAVRSLCSRTIRLHQGSLVQDGDPEDVISQYLANGSNGVIPERIWQDPQTRPGNSHLRLMALRVLNESGEMQKIYGSSQPIIIEMEFDLASMHSALCVGFDLVNQNGIDVFRSSHNDRSEREWPRLKVGYNKLRCIIPSGLLNYGVYYLAPQIGLHSLEWIVNGQTEVGFEVKLDHSDSPFWSIDSRAKFPGVISPCLPWQAIPET